MKIKMIISLLLITAATSSIIALPVSADTSDNHSDFVQEYDILKAYKGTGGNVTIPSNITSISDAAFNGCKNITSITIPSSVTSIGNAAFNNCSGLTSITIQSNVISIGNAAFNGCTGLTSVKIPSRVTSIGVAAFDNCTRLTSVKIPSSVTCIGASAFGGCGGLTIYGVQGSYAQAYANDNSITFSTSDVKVSYTVHMQSYGWQPAVTNGALAGTANNAKRLEAIKINIMGPDLPSDAKIIYEVQVQNYGWQDDVSNGTLAGTVGKSKGLEGIKITLSDVPGYEVQYRIKGQTDSWQNWVTTANGTSIHDAALSFISGKEKQLEAIEIKIVKAAS